MEKENKRKLWALVVDDDVDIRGLLVQILESLSFTCVVSGKLIEAKGKAKNQKFDIIFLDMRLEQGSGEDILEMIRSESSGFNVVSPVVVVSGFLDPELVTRLAEKVSDIIVKPFDVKTFTDRVNNVLLHPKKTLRMRMSEKSNS